MGVYGTNSHEDGNSMLLALGRFWAQSMDRPEVVAGLFNGLGAILGDGISALEDVGDAQLKSAAPVHSTRPLIRLYASAEERATYPKYRYGSGFTYGRTALYGEDGAPRMLRLPEGVLDVQAVVDNPARPSVTYVTGLHFEIEHGFLVFTDQFLPVDGDIEVWLYDCSMDDNPVYDFYGRAFGLEFRASEHYRRFVSAVWDLAHNGPTEFFVRNAIGAALGVPCASTPGNVSYIGEYGGRLIICAGIMVYELPAGSQPVVSVGDLVRYGDQLVDTVRYSDGRILDQAVTRVVVGNNLMHGMAGSLTFDNKFVPVKRAAGRFTFDVGGISDDVEKFWARLDYAAVPDPGYVVNPAMYIHELLRNNATVVTVDYNKLSAAAPGVVALNALTDYLPPHIVYCVQTTVAEADVLPVHSDEIQTAGMGLSTHSAMPVAATAYVTLKTKVNACL